MPVACASPANTPSAAPNRAAAWPSCSRGPRGAQGVDLRRFDALDLDLVHRGKAQHVRVAIRNFDPRFSTEKDANSAHFHPINLRTRDLAGPIALRLSELTVPEWWISQYDLPRDYNLPGLDNAISLTIGRQRRPGLAAPGGAPGRESMIARCSASESRPSCADRLPGTLMALRMIAAGHARYGKACLRA